MSGPTADYLERFPLLHTRDLDLSRSVMGDHYGRHQVALKGRSRFETHVNSVPVGPVGLTYVRCESPLVVECEPLGVAHTLFLPESGSSEFALDGRRLSADPARGVVLAGGSALRIESGPVRLLSLEFPRALVVEALIHRDLAPRECGGLGHEVDLDRGAGAALRSLCRWAARALDRPESALGLGLAGHHLAMTLFSLYLECLPPAPARAVEPMLGQVALEELEAYVVGHLTRPLTVDILAQVARVSPRAIQLAFRKHRGCTPTEFIRRRRLDAARALLLAGDRGTTISEVSLNFGFFHQGRFAQCYRERFGELPTETTRRARPPA